MQHKCCFIGAQKSAIRGFAAGERVQGKIAGKIMGLEVNNGNARLAAAATAGETLPLSTISALTFRSSM